MSALPQAGMELSYHFRCYGIIPLYLTLLSEVRVLIIYKHFGEIQTLF